MRNVLDRRGRLGGPSRRTSARRSRAGSSSAASATAASTLPGVPFDERSGTIANEGGRVEPGVYAAGWIKRGPTGVIGTNKKDATETVELLLEDVAAGRLPRSDATAADVDALLDERGIRRVLYAGWQSIDEVERAAGEKSGRPRVKLCTWDELLAAAERATSIRS